MNKKISLAAVLAFSLVVGQSVFASTADTTNASATMNSEHSKSSDAQSSNCSEKMKKMLSTLKLDDAQKAKIESIREQAKANQKANWEQMKALKVEMNQLIQSDTMDQAQLDSLITKKKDLIGSMMKAKAMAKHEIYTILNPQQKIQFQQMMKQWEEKQHNRHKDC